MELISVCLVFWALQLRLILACQEKLELLKLQCLEAGGVDDWDFYSDSLADGGYYDAQERLEAGLDDSDSDDNDNDPDDSND